MQFKYVKKSLALVLALSMVLVSFAGCSNNDTPDDTSKSGTAEVSPDAGTASSEPVEISMFLASRVADALYTPDTMTFKALAEATNMKFDIQTVLYTELRDKFGVIVASGNLPDVMAGTLNDVNDFGMSGAFKPLGDLINQYAPNLKKYIMDNKDILAQTAASDGQVYAVPMLTAVRTAMGYCIRQDWLDKLQLPVPVTIDDWYKTLTAFKTNDMNGNGAGDVDPLILDRAWENYFMNFADAWGIELSGGNDYWMIKDGKVAFAPILPETKEFLATMAKWYTEGLIDKEFITREDTNNYHILNNKAGATCYWTGYIAGQNVNPEVLKNDPNTNWQVIAPPVLTAGQAPKTYSQQASITGWSWGIAASVSDEKAIAIIKMFDYVYSDEGSKLFNFGIEGQSYQDVNGTLQYTDTVTKSDKGLVTWIRSNGIQALIGMRQMPEYEAASCANDDTRKQLFDYVDKDYFYPMNPALVLTKEEKDAYDVKFSSIKTYVDEELLKFFIGSRPISEFDDFVSRIKQLGIDDMTQLKQQAYDRYEELAQ